MKITALNTSKNMSDHMNKIVFLFLSGTVLIIFVQYKCQNNEKNRYSCLQNIF